MNERISEITGALVAILIFCLLIFCLMLIIQLFRKKNWKKILLFISCDLGLILILTIIGTSAYSQTDEYKEQMAQGETEEIQIVEEQRGEEIQEEEDVEKQNDVQEEMVVPIEIENQELVLESDVKNDETTEVSTETTEENTETDIDALSEEEYKEYCKELWYDDIFFSEENLKGTHVRLEIYVEEWKFFNTYVDQTTQEFINQYNLQRNVSACGVSRGEENSYVGGQIYVYFSDDYEYQQSDYETGKELIIYGEIVDYSTYTWDGYNVCGVIPRYIEEQ